MPLQGWKCPAYGEAPDRNNSFGYCINHCTKQCTSPPVLEALRKSEEEDYHIGKRISVTMLVGGCKRKAFLERTLSFYLYPSDRLPAFRGGLIHALIQNSSDKLREIGWAIELPMALPIESSSGSWVLTGTLDAYDPRTNTIYDMKTLQEYAVQKLVQGKNQNMWSAHIPEAYIKQLNIYRYMAKELGLFDAETLRLQVVTFGGLVLTGTSPSLRFKTGFKWEEEVYEIPNVPLVPDSTIKHWISTEGDQWYRIMYEQEPSSVVDPDWTWLCSKCQFNKTLYCPDPEKEQKGEPVAMLVPNADL